MVKEKVIIENETGLHARPATEISKIAMKYKNYGLSLTDLIAEGNLGLMRAVREFSVEKG